MKDTFCGSYAVFDNAHCVECGGSGYADKMFRIKNSPDVSYGTASVTKGFTAAAVLILVSNGVLTLDTCVAPILGNPPWLAGNVTIRDLLSHTAHVPDYFDEHVMTDFEDLWKTRPNYTFTEPVHFFDMIEAASHTPPDVNIKTMFAYSNSGFVILAAVIAAVSGKPFTSFVTEHVFKPAGMTHTGFWRFDEVPEDGIQRASGYTEKGRTNIYSVPVVGGGDGGCFSSVCDMMLFWSWLEQSGCIHTDVLNVSWSPLNQEIIPSENGTDYYGDFYGLGFWVSKKNSNVVFLEGYDPGVRFVSYYNCVTKRCVSIAQNDECMIDDSVQKKFDSWLFENKQIAM